MFLWEGSAAVTRTIVCRDSVMLMIKRSYGAVIGRKYHSLEI